MEMRKPKCVMLGQAARRACGMGPSQVWMRRSGAEFTEFPSARAASVRGRGARAHRGLIK